MSELNLVGTKQGLLEDEFISHLIVKRFQNSKLKDVKDFNDVRVTVCEETYEYPTINSNKVKMTYYKLYIDNRAVKCISVSKVEGNNNKLVVEMLID